MLLFPLLLSALRILHCSSEDSRVNYTGHEVFSISYEDQAEQKFLEDLIKYAQINVLEYDDGRYDVEVGPEDAKKLENTLKVKKYDYSVKESNLQRAIEEEQDEVVAPPGQEDFQFDQLHSFDDILSYLDSVVSNYEELAEIHEIGTTFEGNPIRGLKIGSQGEDKPAVWIDSGMEACQWVTPATAVYFIEQLVKGYDNNDTIREQLDTYDLYIYPVMNPDGYIYAWTTDRLWRKNRSPNALSPFCVGAHVNRNFDVDFGGPGTENNPCSDFYPGSEAFSEAESKAVRDGVLKLGDRLQLYVSYHAYAEQYMTPYGYTEEKPSDFNDQISALQGTKTGYTYRNGTIAKLKGLTTGTSTDWVYRDGKVVYSYLLEEGDLYYGLILPQDYLVQNIENNFSLFMAILANFQQK